MSVVVRAERDSGPDIELGQLGTPDRPQGSSLLNPERVFDYLFLCSQLQAHEHYNRKGWTVARIAVGGLALFELANIPFTISVLGKLSDDSDAGETTKNLFTGILVTGHVLLTGLAVGVSAVGYRLWGRPLTRYQVAYEAAAALRGQLLIVTSWCKTVARVLDDHPNLADTVSQSLVPLAEFDLTIAEYMAALEEAAAQIIFAGFPTKEMTRDQMRQVTDLAEGLSKSVAALYRGIDEASSDEEQLLKQEFQARIGDVLVETQAAFKKVDTFRNSLARIERAVWRDLDDESVDEALLEDAVQRIHDDAVDSTRSTLAEEIGDLFLPPSRLDGLP